MDQYDLIIVGGGISGMTAALSAVEEGVKKVLLLEREECLGGVLNQCIHNGFGKKILNTEVTGPEYVNFIRNKLSRYPIDIKLETEVLDITRDKVITYVNSKDGVKEIKGSAIILATGCREKYTGSIDISTNSYTGIFTIGNAHRIVNLEGYLPGREPIIVASNKWSLIVARRLHIEGAKVRAILIQENDSFEFNDEMRNIIEGFNMPVYIGGKVIEIFGDERVTGVKIYSSSEEKSVVISCDSLLLSVGYFPEMRLIRKIKVGIDENTLGPIVKEYETEVRGIFACGNLIHGIKSLKEKDVNGGGAGKKAAEYLRKYFY